MQPDGTRVFIACTPENYISIVDLKTLEITGKLEAGKNPDGLAWAEQK
jgi:YVTN family beta-propeller protein